MIFKKHAVKMRSSLILTIIFIFTINLSFSQTITKKRGKVTTNYSNGNRESSGKVKNFKKQGAWKYWDENGKLEKVITYKDDVKNGLYTEFYSDGKKSVEGIYLKGRKNGEWNSWYTDGKLSSKLNFDGTNFTAEPSDIFVGVQKWWFEDGQIREQTKYENHKIVYRWTWFKNGRTNSVEYYENNLKNGTWRIYPDPSEATDSLPASIDNYSNGKREGVHLGYYHGKLSEEIHYKNDKLDGTYKKWDSNGMLGISENYVNGNRDGLCRYFNYGKCIRELTYSDGKINGEEKEYDGTGMMFRISWYNKGQLDSTHNFHPNGKISISRNYKYYPGFAKTEEFSTYTEWDSEGVLLLKGTYHFEMKDKDWTTYYANGKIKSITPYTAGKIKGVYKKWYANGKEIIEMECEGNNVITQPKVWDNNGKPIKAGTKQYQEIVDSSKPGEIYNDPKKYRENRTALSDEVLQKDENQKAVGGRGETTHANVSTDEPVFQFVETMPEFPGGNDSMNVFLQLNIKYPPIGRDPKTGTVYISFVVEKDGTVTNVKALKEISGAPELTAEAIRVVNSMPKFSPGKMNGIPVRVEYKLPVRFQLQ